MKGSNPPIELATEEQLQLMRVEYQRIKELIACYQDDLVFEYEADLVALNNDYYLAGGRDISNK